MTDLRLAQRIGYVVSDQSGSPRTAGFVLGAIIATMDDYQRQKVAEMLRAMLEVRDELGVTSLGKHGRMAVQSVVNELLKR